MSIVVVTGAAGNLGRRVTSALAARPQVERVLAVDRVPVPSTAPEVESHIFDLASPGAAEELAALAKEADAVINLAWAPEGDGNLALLHNVLDAADAIGPDKFVHLSSATVYGAWPDNPVPMVEEVPPRPNPELSYAIDKRSAEVLVDGWALRHPEIAVAVLRPACTVGSTEHPLYQALAATRSSPLGAQSRTVQYLHIDDLVSAVLHTWALGLAGTYNVAPDGGVDERAAAALTGGTPSVPLPPTVRDRLAGWRWKLSQRGAPPDVRAYAEHSWVVAGDKLRSTGWRPEYSSEEALVVTDKRSHWDELPTLRRVALVAAGTAVLAAGAGGAVWRHHRR